MMFLENDKKQPDVEIPHELMHALDLGHTFRENSDKDRNKKHIFDQGVTRNYMDYDNTKLYTQKWQWEKMRISEKLLPILFLFFSLCSCMSYKKVSCEYDYTISEKEKVLDISAKFSDEEKKNGNYTTWISKRKNSYSKHIYNDTLGISFDKYINYDLEGKIKYVFYSVGVNADVGKSYKFDSEGNITEEINYDQGWDICWQQALFIAKRYVSRRNIGKKLSDEERKWVIAKEENYKKYGKVWKIYYNTRKQINRTTSNILYIEAKTGKIVDKGKVSFHPS